MRIFLLLSATSLAACNSPKAPQPEPPIQFEQLSANIVERGQRLSRVLGCIGCHGEQLTGEDWSEPGFGQMWTANLTRAVVDYNDSELIEVIKGGSRRDRELWGMPSHLFAQMTEDDMASLIAFLRSEPPAGEVHPAPVFEEGGRREIATGLFKSSKAEVNEMGTKWPPDVGPGFELGRYIVRATCAECHRMDLRGGTPHEGAQPRPDLRMVAAYDEEQFRHLLRTGKAIGNREVSLMSEVARGRYKHLTNAEIAAVHGYLRQVAETFP